MAVFLSIKQIEQQDPNETYASKIAKQLHMACKLKGNPGTGAEGLLTVCLEARTALGYTRVAAMRLRTDFDWKKLTSSPINRAILTQLDAAYDEVQPDFHSAVLVTDCHGDATPDMVLAWDGISLPPLGDTDWEVRRFIGGRTLVITSWTNYLARLKLEREQNR